MGQGGEWREMLREKEESKLISRFLGLVPFHEIGNKVGKSRFQRKNNELSFEHFKFQMLRII